MVIVEIKTTWNYVISVCLTERYTALYFFNVVPVSSGGSRKLYLGWQRDGRRFSWGHEVNSTHESNTRPRHREANVLTSRTPCCLTHFYLVIIYVSIIYNNIVTTYSGIESTVNSLIAMGTHSANHWAKSLDHVHHNHYGREHKVTGPFQK